MNNTISNACEDLFERIIEAQNIMLKNDVEANTVIINSHKYGKLSREIQYKLFHGYTPTIVGLAATTAPLDDEWDFVIMESDYPPQSQYDMLCAENRALREELNRMREMATEFLEKIKR